MLVLVSTTDPLDLGPNAWMADEMRSRWKADPASVDPAWRVIFEAEPANGIGNPNGAADATAPIEVPSVDVTPTTAALSSLWPPAAPAKPEVKLPTPMQRDDNGAAAPVPAPSNAGQREVDPTPRSSSPCEVHRPASSPTWKRRSRCPRRRAFVRCQRSCSRSIARSSTALGRKLNGKVSFTHLIGYAVVRDRRLDAGDEQHLHHR